MWRFAVTAIVLACVSPVARAQKPSPTLASPKRGITDNHVSAKRSESGEDAVLKYIRRNHQGSKVHDITSANLDDCLMWSEDEFEHADVRSKFPQKYLPTDFKGSAVVFDIQYAGQAMVFGGTCYLVNPEGQVFRVWNPVNIKLSGGKQALKEGKPTTRGKMRDLTKLPLSLPE
jgi:hypothetical protein